MYAFIAESLNEEDVDAVEIDKEIEIIFSNPELLRQQTYQQAQGEYVSKKEWKETFEKTYDFLKEEESGEEIISELREANEELVSFFKLQDKIIKYLVEIADEESIEKALSYEAQKEVIKKVFLTKEMYINTYMKAIETNKKYLASVQNAMMKDGETGMFVNAMIKGMQKARESIQEVSEQAIKEMIVKKAEEIYGA